MVGKRNIKAEYIQDYGRNSYITFLLLTRMGSHPLLMVDVKVYYSQREWVHTLC